jgi:hypothetical protein
MARKNHHKTQTVCFALHFIPPLRTVSGISKALNKYANEEMNEWALQSSCANTWCALSDKWLLISSTKWGFNQSCLWHTLRGKRKWDLLSSEYSRPQCKVSQVSLLVVLEELREVRSVEKAAEMWDHGSRSPAGKGCCRPQGRRCVKLAFSGEPLGVGNCHIPRRRYSWLPPGKTHLRLIFIPSLGLGGTS